MPVHVRRQASRLNGKAPTCGAFAEPSSGLEPETPSLPSRPGPLRGVADARGKARLSGHRRGRLATGCCRLRPLCSMSAPRSHVRTRAARRARSARSSITCWCWRGRIPDLDPSPPVSGQLTSASVVDVDLVNRPPRVGAVCLDHFQVARRLRGERDVEEVVTGGVGDSAGADDG